MRPKICGNLDKNWPVNWSIGVPIVLIAEDKELAAYGILFGQLAGLAIFADARAAVGPSGPLTGPIDMFLYALGHAAPPRPPE
jgi:hypothetical protein